MATIEPLDPQTRPSVVVTGASSGIGREIARIAARDGDPVLLIGRSEERLGAVANAIKSDGGTAFWLAVDLGAPDAGAVVEAELDRRRFYCDVLVNSAGFGLWGHSAALSRDEQLALIDLNIRALTDLALRFLPGMMARRRGGIVNLSSVAGSVPGPYMALYYASKAFVRSFSHALSGETRNSGVTVTCVMPGPVDTAFFERSGARRAKLFRVLPQKNAARVAEIAWSAFRRGKAEIVVGRLNWWLVSLIPLMPLRFKLPMMHRLMRRRGRRH